MYKVHELKDSSKNNGSVTVEMCCVIPIVLWICVNIIFVFLDVIGDGVSQGECYTMIYTYSGNERQNQDGFAQSVLVTEHHLLSRGKLFDSQDDGYSYKGNSTTYKTEYDLCTIRLRRWQLYGNVLHE